MLATNNIDKKIITLLPPLSPKQKKAVLSVVKTFAESHAEGWDEEEYKLEMDRRCTDYENGTVETFTIEQSISAVKASYSKKQNVANAL